MRREQAVTLYFRSPAQREALQARAAAEGYESDFNGWLLQLVTTATSGTVYPREYVEGLRKDLEKARAALDNSREEAMDYRAQMKSALAQRDAALAVILALDEGQQIAARLLKQSPSGVVA